MTLASTTSLAEPLGAAGAGAAEEAAAAAAAANAAADADADEAAERAARRDMGSPQPPETPRDRLSHSGGPAAAGKCSLLTTTIATRAQDTVKLFLAGGTPHLQTSCIPCAQCQFWAWHPDEPCSKSPRQG